MDVNTELAPSVVAVVVAHEPCEGLSDVLEGLAAQDYPNLKALFLIAGEAGDLPSRISERLPDAFVRAVAGNPGFGAAANEVLRLVEGDNGFFLLMHDDVALDPDAVRLLVEELYRSNAGIVGPKLVEWADPNVLQHVGLGVDRFGEVDPLVEPGEVDQEQHDAVRDVFALPSACLLVRADLFRALGGYGTTVDFHGEDLDLCWRAHLNGARVVVVPTAHARHRELLVERRPDLNHRLVAARHRVRSVATLTGGLRLPLVLLQLLLVSLLEMVVGLFTGRLGEAVASFRSTVGLIPRAGSVIRRRREVSKLRRVPYREVAGLQIRGSARLQSYLRTRETSHIAVDHSAVGNRRFSRNTAGQIAAWISILALAVIGSRSFITNGVPLVGEYLPFPASTRTMLGDYWSGWWGHGLGSTVAVPTGIGVLGVAGIASLGNMGLFHTLAVLAWLPIGYYGAWRLMSIFPSSRARIVGLLTYAAIPLPYAALGAGRWGVVASYGAAPWVVHLLRSVAGIVPALTAKANLDVADGHQPPSRREALRWLAQLVVLCAVVVAFVPSFMLIVSFIGVVLALATIVARGSLRAALTLVGATIIAVIGAALLNFGWFSTLFGSAGWDSFVGPPQAQSEPIDVVQILRFGIGPTALGVLAVGLWLPVLVAPLLARGWRLTWAARGGMLAVGSFFIAVLGATDALGFRLPELGLVLVPAAVGLALAAACATAAFEQDVQGGSFGWRQPLGVASGLAILLGAIPAVIATGNGHWSTPTETLLQPSDQLPPGVPDGDYRVLFLGDPRVMPVAAWRLDNVDGTNMAYSLIDDGATTIDEHWAGNPSDAEQAVADVLDLLATDATARIGRLLAPFAVRYVVVPVVDGVNSTTDDPLPLPVGLIDALTTQLDMKRMYTPPNYIAFENTAWIATQSTLSDVAAQASEEAGPEALASRDFSGSIPQLVGMADRGPGSDDIPAGALAVAKPFDQRWSLTIAADAIEPRVAFGATMVFDVSAPGGARFDYHTASSRYVVVVVQIMLWLAAVLTASSIRWGWLRRRRMRTASVDGPVLSFDADAVALVSEPALTAADDGFQS